MDFIGGRSEMSNMVEVKIRDQFSEILEEKGEEKFGFSQKALDKYDEILEDDCICNTEPIQMDEGQIMDNAECEKKFNELFEDGNSDEEYFDDNKNLYRTGIDLTPNNNYELNGYKYKTDGQGRIISAEGKLHLKNREGRLPIRDSLDDIGKGDQREGDDRGHLIGDQFDGSNGLENMIPQDAGINRNDFKNFENELAKEVKAGKEVVVGIEPVYETESRRPTAIVVSYCINGNDGMRIFPNELGGLR